MKKKFIIFIIFFCIISLTCVGILISISFSRSNGDSKNTPEATEQVTESATAPAAATATVPAAATTTSVPNQNFVANSSIPVLIYHCVDDNVFGLKDLFVSPKNFEAQMNYLKDNGYTPITFQDLGNLGNFTKPIIITLDDGYMDNFTEAYPILKKFNFKATIFVISGMLGKKDYLTIDQIKEMTDIINFQGHTITHPDLKKMQVQDINKLRDELSKSKSDIEAITGKPVNVLAYPAGSYSNGVISVAKEYYTFAVTTKPGIFKYGTDSNYEIKRLRVKSTTTLDLFIKNLDGLYSSK